MTWLSESLWEVYFPIKDSGVDLIARHPQIRRLVLVQIKHKEPGANRQNRINRHWDPNRKTFDCLVVYQPKLERGLILPWRLLTNPGATFSFGYIGSGDGAYPKYRRYVFDLRGQPISAHSAIFVSAFERAHLGWSPKTGIAG
jgi:hypothetical protein